MPLLLSLSPRFFGGEGADVHMLPVHSFFKFEFLTVVPQTSIKSIEFKQLGTVKRATPFNIQNRPFPSSLVSLFQNESKCETSHMKMSSACIFIFMQIKVIFIRKVSHLEFLLVLMSKYYTLRASILLDFSG